MTRQFALVSLLLFAACSSGIGPLEKPAPAPVSQESLIRPPWQALVKAGPDAATDVDLETLDGPKAVVAQVQPAPPPAPPPPKPVVPGATEIKAVAVANVNGASAIGNKELSTAMRKVLKGAGWPVLTQPRKDALSISALVVLDAPTGANQGVHITWTVTSPKGRVLGTVAQNNAVGSHSLDSAWGPAADAVAEAAADGIFRLIGQYR